MQRSWGREQRKALAGHRPFPRPKPPVVLLGQGSGHSWIEARKDRQTVARASNSFCLELDSSVLAVGKWFSIGSIIFFL